MSKAIEAIVYISTDGSEWSLTIDNMMTGLHITDEQKDTLVDEGVPIL
jgi:hypothetical protein